MGTGVLGFSPEPPVQVIDILTPVRVAVSGAACGHVAGESPGKPAKPIRNKQDALRCLAELLCSRTTNEDLADSLKPDEVEALLAKREEQQSTGVGGGVAIPHAFGDLTQIRGAVLLCPDAVKFDAVDGLPVKIFFAVIGPRREVGAHLKTLARVSRLLRDEAFRQRLVEAKDGRAAFDLIVREESRPQ